MKNKNPRFEFVADQNRIYKAGNWNAIWNTNIYRDNNDIEDVIKSCLTAEEQNQIRFDSESSEFYAYLTPHAIYPQQIAERFTEIIKNDIIRKLFNQS